MANIASIKVRKTNTVYGIQDAAASLAIEQMKNGTDIDSFGDVETALADKADASDLSAILDGTNIDSFGDVETALATKVDKVTGKGLSTNDYDDTAKGIVDNIQSNVIANTKLIKDTVGWSGKNKWDKSKTVGIDATITQTSDGFRAQVSSHTWGSARCDFATPEKNKDFILTCKANVATAGNFMKMQVYGSTDGSDYSNSIAVTDTYSATKELELAFNSGNYNYLRITLYLTNGTATSADVTFEKPMLRDADILDSTYEPYFGSTAFPRSEQAVLGAKNLLPNNNTTQTINGIPFTKNADGSVTIGAGTASANTSYILGDIKPKAGNYILSRGTTNGQAFLSVSKYNGSTWVAGLVEIGNQAISEKEFTIDYVGYDTVRGFLYIGSGVTISTPYTVYPMIRVASDKDDTYVPYAMTNQQLTDAAKLRTVIPTIDGTIVKTYKGGLVAYNLLTRVCTFGMRLVVGSYANYVNFMTGLPKAKSIYSFPCVCTNFARNVGMAVLTTSADGGMYFTGLGQAANFADGDELNISGSYIIADDVVS